MFGRRASVTCKSPVTTATGGSDLINRLLYRRDQWGLGYGADVPPCLPAVPSTPDAAVPRERFAAALTRAWNETAAAGYPTATFPEDDPDLLLALVTGLDQGDQDAIRSWARTTKRRVRALPHALQHNAGWLAREMMLTAEPEPLLNIVLLPVEGDWLRIDGSTILGSIGLYSDVERFRVALSAAIEEGRDAA